MRRSDRPAEEVRSYIPFPLPQPSSTWALLKYYMRLLRQVLVRNGVQVEAVPPDFSELDYVPLRTRYPKYKVSIQEDPAEVALLSKLSVHKVSLFPTLASLLPYEGTVSILPLLLLPTQSRGPANHFIPTCVFRFPPPSLSSPPARMSSDSSRKCTISAQCSNMFELKTLIGLVKAYHPAIC